MSTKGIADVIFCLDASDSMRPCFDGVRAHISNFLEGLKGDRQRSWDIRFDFVAHHTERSASGAILHAHYSLYHNGVNGSVIDNLYINPTEVGYFTNDVEEFKRGLSQVEALGDEGPLVALDSCLDFPWRKEGECHRVIIFMTDEPFETSSEPNEEKRFLPEIQKKIQDLRILLFLVAPDSPIFEQLSAVDKCEYETVDNESNGLADVDFRELLYQIGKSVSVSVVGQQGGPTEKKVSKGLFGQATWGADIGVDQSDRT